MGLWTLVGAQSYDLRTKRPFEICAYLKRCTVGLMMICACSAEWSCKSEGIITYLRTWRSIWPPPRSVNTGSKRDPIPFLKFLEPCTKTTTFSTRNNVHDLQCTTAVSYELLFWSFQSHNQTLQKYRPNRLNHVIIKQIAICFIKLQNWNDTEFYFPWKCSIYTDELSCSLSNKKKK